MNVPPEIKAPLYLKRVAFLGRCEWRTLVLEDKDLGPEVAGIVYIRYILSPEYEQYYIHLQMVKRDTELRSQPPLPIIFTHLTP